MIIKVLTNFFHTFFTKISRNSPLLLKIVFLKAQCNIAPSTRGHYAPSAFFPLKTFAIPFLASIIGKNMIIADAIDTHATDIATHTA